MRQLPIFLQSQRDAPLIPHHHKSTLNVAY
jgi:hypothetical protein